MRVLHVDAGNMFGGVETLLVTLARNRAASPDMQPEFAVCFNGRLATELAEAGASVHRLGEVRARNPWSVLRARRTLARLLSAADFDVVVCHMPWVHAVFGPVAKRSKIPLVFWLHSAAKKMHWVERWASLARPDLVICSSQFCVQSVANIFPEARTELVYYPINDEANSLGLRPRRVVREELEAAEDDTVIIQVSRLEGGKGHILHLRALAELREIPGWVCWMVGGPQSASEKRYFASLKRQAEELGLMARVRFLGQRSDVADLLNAADVFCQPNTQPEPFGIVFVEALFAGLPVVATALGGSREILSEDCAFLVEPNDWHALGSALRRLVEQKELRTCHGSAGRMRARELCDVRNQVRKLYDALSAGCPSQPGTSDPILPFPRSGDPKV